MAIVQFGPVQFDADLVVLDKDGTLVDFDLMWGQFAREWIAEVVTCIDLPYLETSFLETLGHDAKRQETRPGTPLVSGSAEQLQAIVATLLLQSGFQWSESIEIVSRSFDLVALRSPPHERVQSFGNAAGLLADLQSVGVKVAVITTDDRRPTTHILEQLGISQYVDMMVCGDDGIAWKPAPDMLSLACARLSVSPARTVVIGDTVLDMKMAESGGAGLRVAVLSGMGDEQRLRKSADVVLSSIANVSIVAKSLLA